MNSFDRFNETKLPDETDFYSLLSNEEISPILTLKTYGKHLK